MEDQIAATEPVIVQAAPSTNKTIYIVIIVVLVMLLVASAVIIAFLALRGGNSVTTVVTPTPQITAPATSSTPEITKGVITGSVSFPSEVLPSMKICAVDITSKVESCVDQAEGDSEYNLLVNAGKYYVYAIESNFRAYFTKCDSLETNKCTDEKWFNEKFICYNDTQCTAAYKPVVVEVKTSNVTSGINLSNGWYLPCSNECQQQDSEVMWSHYLN